MAKSILLAALGLLFFVGFVFVYVQDTVAPNMMPQIVEERLKGEGRMIISDEASTGTEVKNLIGRITSIDGNILTLFVESYVDPNADASLFERNVTLTDATVVSTFAERDPELVKQEIEALKERIATKERMEAEARAAGANIPETEDPIIPDELPVVFDRQAATRDALQVDQRVNIFTDVDVRNERNFTAASIDILPVPPAGTDSTSP